MSTAAAARATEAGLAETFNAIAWEVELAGARCMMLDSLIGQVMKDLPPERREQLVQGLHTVDLLSQHLNGISAFVRQLTETAPPEVSLEVAQALSTVTLGALADRMRSSLGGPEEGIEERADAGELDLF
jgi:hypothetical protein